MNPDFYSLYTNIKNPGSFAGINKFYDLVKKRYPNATRDEVKAFLAATDSYTLHKPKQKIKKFRKILVKRLNYQYSMDLVDLQSHSRINRGYRWILNIIGSI